MPLQQTPTGLQIQPFSEILAELQGAYADPVEGFGADVKVQANDAFGLLISIWAEREALWQQLQLAQQSGFDPQVSSGTDLDTVRGLTGSSRKTAFQSESTSGQCNGTPGTIIVNLAQVRNTETEDLWQIIGGPYVIGGGGFIAVTVQAMEVGARTFETATPWTIETPIPGWATFETTADIDPEDIGQLNETDVSYRERSKGDLLVRGNDLEAIKANVLRVTNVILAQAYENTNCSDFVDGIAPGALEVVVDGGNDTEVAQAILDRKPPGAEAFGLTTIVPLTDSEGNPINIGFTRPTDIDMGILVEINRTGAEIPMPDNWEQTVKDALLAFGNSTANIGQDVQPQTFEGVVYTTLLDPTTGKFPLTSVVGKTAEIPFGYSTAIFPIDNRSRADFDSANIFVVDVT